MTSEARREDCSPRLGSSPWKAAGLEACPALKKRRLLLGRAGVCARSHHGRSPERGSAATGPRFPIPDPEAGKSHLGIGNRPFGIPNDVPAKRRRYGGRIRSDLHRASGPIGLAGHVLFRVGCPFTRGMTMILVESIPGPSH